MAHDIHDAFFKATFSQAEHAAGELRLVLPARLAGRIDFMELTLCPGSFVDESLSQQHADLLFTTPLAGRAAFLYVLFEHKSGLEALTAFQLLRYMVRIWEDFLKKQPKARQLPAIVPVVLHHGEGGWTCARSFQELLDVDEEVLADLGGVRAPVPVPARRSGRGDGRGAAGACDEHAGSNFAVVFAGTPGRRKRS